MKNRSKTVPADVVANELAHSHQGCSPDTNQALYPNLRDDRNGAESNEPAARGKNSPTPSVVASKRIEKQHKKWNRRMRLLFCCLGHKRNKESIADVASIFAEFFADLNVPPSDIAAGFVLLSKYQAAQRQWILKNRHQHELRIDQYLSGVAIKDETKYLDILNAEDSHLINELIYYMNYSLAIFGWPLQIIEDPCMLCCLYPYLRLWPCCSGGNRARHKTPADEGEPTDEERKKRKQQAKKKRKAKETKKSKGKGDENKEQRADSDGPVESNSDPQIRECDENNNLNIRASNKCQGPTQSRQILETSQSIPGRLNADCDMPVILDDNCCSCNSASAEQRLARHNYEIVYISYRSDVNVVPFLVAADHSKRTIVVAIRGSMSLSDMITDMNGTVDKLPIESCPDDWLCHRGITNAANYVKTTLQKDLILERAFNCRPDLGSNNYNLILCGHSLGAGAAAILGVLMRPQYPTLRAYLYSPPGGILSLPVVEYTKEFAVGIILGNDTVARLGVAQMERLRYQTLLSLKSSQKSSGKILTRALCPSMCCGRNQVDYEPEQSLDLLHGLNGRPFEYNNNVIHFQTQPLMLYVPGRLVHIVKNFSFRSRSQRLWSGPIYQAVWSDNTNYDRVLFDEGMFLDHLPQNLMRAMKMLFSRTLPGRHQTVKSTQASAQQVQNGSSAFAKHKITSSDANMTDCPAIRVATIKVDLHRQELDDNNNHDKDRERAKLAQVKDVIEDDDNNNNGKDMNNNDNNSNDKSDTEMVLNAASLDEHREKHLGKDSPTWE